MTRLLVAVVVASVLVAGCGGVENQPNLAEAAERTEALGTGRFEVEGFQKADGTQIPLSCAGSADYDRKRVQVRCDGGLGELEAIAIGGDSYFRGEMFLGPGTGDKWEHDTSEIDEETSLGTLSPQKLLALLRKASSETERIGEEDVRGDATVRYRLTVDCEAAILECEGSAPVDVWIADDGIVRRIAIDDDEAETIFEFFDFGADVVIEPPAADELLDEDDLGSSGISSGSGSSCATQASPISVERASSALEQYGFAVERDDLGCSPVVAASLSAVASSPEHSILSCSVLAKPEAPGFVTSGAFAEPRLEKVERRYENVQCTLFAEDQSGGPARRLDAAFAELRR